MKTRGPLLLLLATAALLGIGVWRLFDLRFATGDVYPRGSTFRADAAGTRAYFESLGLVPRRTVSRSLLPLSTLRGGPATTVFLLAVDPGDAWLRPRDQAALKDLLANGTRLVIALDPPAISHRGRTNVPVLPRTARDGLQTLTSALELPALMPEVRTLAAIQFPTASRAEDAPASLPAQIPWRAAGFDASSEGWSALYTHGDSPVVLEKRIGRGTVVLLAESELFSNDALRHQRQSALLAWLAGSSTHLVFDETHLGTRLDPGIMTLVRRYGLTGFLAAVIAVAGLSLWRGSSSLVPRLPDAAPENREVVTGRDATAGFIHMLKRSVAPHELPALCLAEWRRTLPRNRPDLHRKAAALQDAVNLAAALPPREQSPVLTHRQMVEILSRP